jgi:BASS family bile acid:Na+ symporter
MTAQDLFNAIFNASLVVMITTLVAGLGMSLSVRQIVAPLGKVGLLVATVVANTLLAPLVAIGICGLFPLTSQAAVGVELATMAAAGPVGMKAAQLTKRADMATALSFTIVLQLLNILAAPLWARQIVTGATVDLWTIVKNLLLLVLAPLVIGLILRGRYSEHAEGWKTELEKASNIALVVAIAVGIAVNWTTLVDALGSWVMAASAVIVIVYIVLGWVAGRVGGEESAITVAGISSMRFTPLGLIVIATVLHNQGDYLIPALLFSLVDTVIPLVAGVEAGRLASRVHPRTASRTSGSGRLGTSESTS